MRSQAVGYLFRMAGPQQLEQGVRSLLAEQARQPVWERSQGAGLLLAESIISVAHGLHSRAAGVLKLMMQEDLLTVNHLVRPAAGEGSDPQAATAALGNGEVAAASAAGSNVASPAGEAAEASAAAAATTAGLSQEVLRARATAVCSAAMQRILEHLRRGKCQVRSFGSWLEFCHIFVLYSHLHLKNASIE